MSKTYQLLQRAKQIRAAALDAVPPKPAVPVEEETPYIEVGGPDAIEASADVLACPPPARKLFLHPPTPPAATVKQPAGSRDHRVLFVEREGGGIGKSSGKGLSTTSLGVVPH